MNENKRFLEGCEKLADGRYRIHEKMIVTPIKCKEPITEKIIVEGKEVSPKRKYTFLVWRKDKVIGDGSGINGNFRNYSLVIPRTIKENRPTFTLADHPLDGCEPDSVRITGCGKNYRMIGDWMATDWYPLGEIGNRLADGFDLGVPATISSSVLGELDDNGYVVDSDTFFLERILDNLIVLPSNGVFHYQDHADQIDDNYSFNTISEQGFKESTRKENLTILNKDSSIVESSENKQNDKADVSKNNMKKGEGSMPENATNDELIQQSMMLNIKSMIKDADEMDSPFDRKEALISADCFAKKLTDVTLHDEICKKIEDADNEIKELSAKGLQTDDLAEKVKGLEDELAKAKEELDSVKNEKLEVEKKLDTVTNMYEEEQYKASEVEIEKSEELEERNHRLSRELCSLKAKNRNLEGTMRRNTRVLEAKMKKAEADANTKVDVETVVACNKKIKNLENEVVELKSKLRKAEDEVETMKKTTDALDVEVGAEEIVALKEKINELSAKNNRLRRALNEARISKIEKKSRFSTLKKSMEEDDENIVTDDVINSDEIADDEVTVTDNGIQIEERDEDEIMEKLLHK